MMDYHSHHGFRPRRTDAPLSGDLRVGMQSGLRIRKLFRRRRKKRDQVRRDTRELPPHRGQNTHSGQSIKVCVNYGVYLPRILAFGDGERGSEAVVF